MMSRKTIITAFAIAAAFQLYAQQVETKSSTINLGQVIYRMPVTAEFELQNTSGTTLNIENVKTSCGCTTVDYPRNGIAAGQSFKVAATYDSKQMGHFEKQVGLYLDNDEPPVLLTLKGVVVDEIHDFAGQYPYSIGELSIDKRDIEFDDVNIGDRPFQEIHIKTTLTSACRLSSCTCRHT